MWCLADPWFVPDEPTEAIAQAEDLSSVYTTYATNDGRVYLWNRPTTCCLARMTPMTPGRLADDEADMSAPVGKSHHDGRLVIWRAQAPFGSVFKWLTHRNFEFGLAAVLLLDGEL